MSTNELFDDIEIIEIVPETPIETGGPLIVEAEDIIAELNNDWPDDEEIWNHVTLSKLESYINHRNPSFSGQSAFPSQHLILKLSSPLNNNINASHSVKTDENGDWKFKFTNRNDFGTTFFCRSCEFTLSIQKPRSSLISDIFNPLAEAKINFVLDEVNPDIYSSLKLDVESVPLNINDQVEGVVNPVITDITKFPPGGSGAVTTSEQLLFIVESSDASTLKGILEDHQIDQHGYKITAEVISQGKQLEFSTFVSASEGLPAEWHIDLGDTFKEEGTYQVNLKSMDAARNVHVDQNKVLIQVLAERPVTPEIQGLKELKGDNNFIFFENKPEKLTLSGRAQFQKGAEVEILDANNKIISKARIKPNGTWTQKLNDTAPGENIFRARWRKQEITSNISEPLKIIVASHSPIPDHQITEFGETFTSDEIDNGFGASVALSGDGKVLAIGSPYQKDGESMLGKVDVYKLSKRNKWKKFGSPIQGTDNGAEFGAALSISNDGKIIAVGAPAGGLCSKFESNSKSNGSIYLFESKKSSKEWVPFLEDEIDKQIESILDGKQCLEIGKTIRFSEDNLAIEFGSNLNIDSGETDKVQSIHSINISEVSRSSSQIPARREENNLDIVEENFSLEDNRFDFSDSIQTIVHSQEINGQGTVQTFQKNVANIQLSKQSDTGASGDNRTSSSKPSFIVKMQDLPDGTKLLLRDTETNQILAEGTAKPTLLPDLDKQIVHTIPLVANQQLNDGEYTAELFIIDTDGNEYQPASTNSTYSFVVDTHFLESTSNPAGDYAAYLSAVEPIRYYVDETSGTSCSKQESQNTVKIFLSDYQKSENQEILIFDLKGKFVERLKFDGSKKDHIETCIPKGYNNASDLIIFHNNSENAHPVLTGEYGEEVQVEIINKKNRELIAKVNSDENGAWSYSFEESLPRDEYQFLIRATDLAGNTRSVDSEIAINVRERVISKPSNIEGNSLVEDTQIFLDNLPPLPAIVIPKEMRKRSSEAKKKYLEHQTTKYLGKPLLEQSLQKINRMIVGSSDLILDPYEKKKALSQLTRSAFLTRVHEAYLQNPEEHSPALNSYIFATNIVSGLSDFHKLNEAWLSTNYIEREKDVYRQFTPLKSYLDTSNSPNLVFNPAFDKNKNNIVGQGIENPMLHVTHNTLRARDAKISEFSEMIDEVMDTDNGLKMSELTSEFVAKGFFKKGNLNHIELKLDLEEGLKKEKNIKSLNLGAMEGLKFELVNLKDSIDFLKKQIEDPSRKQFHDQDKAALEAGIIRQKEALAEYAVASARVESSQAKIETLENIKGKINSGKVSTFESQKRIEESIGRRLNDFSLYIRGQKVPLAKGIGFLGNPLSLSADIWSVTQNNEPNIVDNLSLSASAFDTLGDVLRLGNSATKSKTSKITKTRLRRLAAGTEVVSGALIAGAMTAENIRLANCLEQDNLCGTTADAINGQIAANSVQTSLALLESASTLALDQISKNSAKASKIGTKASKASKMATKILGKAAPVFGSVAAVAGAIDPIKWEEFHQKSRVIEGYDPTQDSSTELYVDALNHALPREKGFYIARQGVDVATGVAASLLMASGFGAPVGFLVVASSFAINAILTAIEHDVIEAESKALLSKLNQSGGGGTSNEGVTQHFNNRLQEQREMFLGKNADLVKSYLRDGDEPYTDITIGYSVALTETDLKTATRARSGNLLEKTYENFFDSVSSDAIQCGEFGPENFVSDEIQVNLDEAVVNLPKPTNKSTSGKNSEDCNLEDSDNDAGDEEIVNKRLLKFLSPLRPQGVEMSNRREDGKNRYVTSLEFKDLKKGWHIIDSKKSNSTFSIDDNWVTQFSAKKGGAIENISMKISADDGDDQYFSGFAETTALMGDGNDNVTYSSEKLNEFLDNTNFALTIKRKSGKTDEILITKKLLPGVPSLKQDFRKLIEREGDIVEVKDYTVVVTEKSKDKQEKVDTIQSVENLSTSQSDDLIDLSGTNMVKRLVLNDGDDVIVNTGRAIEDIYAGNGDDAVVLKDNFPSHVEMGNGHDYLAIDKSLTDFVVDHQTKDAANDVSANDVAKRIFNAGPGVDILEVPDSIVKSTVDDHKQQIATNQFVFDMAKSLNDNGTAIAQNLNGYLKHPSKYSTIATNFEWYKYKLPQFDNILSKNELVNSNKYLYGAYSTPALNGFTSGNDDLDQHYHIKDYKELLNYMFNSDDNNIIFSAENKAKSAVIWGIEEEDVLIGSKNSDAIFAGGGHDILVSNTNFYQDKDNHDVLSGGTGYDIYMQRSFNGDSQHVVIHPGEGLHTLNGDVLRLSSDLDDLSFLHQGDDLILVDKNLKSTTLKDFYKGDGYTIFLASFDPYRPSKEFDPPFNYRVLSSASNVAKYYHKRTGGKGSISEFFFDHQHKHQTIQRDFVIPEMSLLAESLNRGFGVPIHSNSDFSKQTIENKLDSVLVYMSKDENKKLESYVSKDISTVKNMENINGDVVSNKGSDFRNSYNKEMASNTHLTALNQADDASKQPPETVKHFKFFYQEPERTNCGRPDIGLFNDDYFFGLKDIFEPEIERQGEGLITIPSVEKENHVYNFYSFGTHKFLDPNDPRDLDGDTIVIFGTPLEKLTFLLNDNDLIIADIEHSYTSKTSKGSSQTLYNLSFRSTLTIKNYLDFIDSVDLDITSVDNITNPVFETASELRNRFQKTEAEDLYSISLVKPVESQNDLRELSKIIQKNAQMSSDAALKLLNSIDLSSDPTVILDSLSFGEAFTLRKDIDGIVNRNADNANQVLVARREKASDSALYASDLNNGTDVGILNSLDHNDVVTGGRPVSLKMKTYDALIAKNPKNNFKNGELISSQIDNNFMMSMIRKDNPPSCLEISRNMISFWASYNEADKVYKDVITDIRNGDGEQYLSQSSLF